MDDILDSLFGSQWFSTLDLRSGYWQVEGDPTDREKTAFTTPYGLYQFKVMPFGLSNAPSTFQRLMELILAGLHWETCLIYLNDVVVFGRTWEEHMLRIREVLSRLLRANLKLNPEKCQFFRKSVSFLRHIISDQGMSTDPDKVRAITQWPTPTSPEDLRSFLGLASYYRRFIHKFAEIAAPLHRMQDNNSKFSGASNVKKHFSLLNRSSVLLLYWHFQIPRTHSSCTRNANDVGIGSVLSQVQDEVERVISYGSRTLSNISQRRIIVLPGKNFWLWFILCANFAPICSPLHCRYQHHSRSLCRMNVSLGFGNASTGAELSFCLRD